MNFNKVMWLLLTKLTFSHDIPIFKWCNRLGIQCILLRQLGIVRLGWYLWWSGGECPIQQPVDTLFTSLICVHGPVMPRANRGMHCCQGWMKPDWFGFANLLFGNGKQNSVCRLEQQTEFRLFFQTHQKTCIYNWISLNWTVRNAFVCFAGVLGLWPWFVLDKALN